MDKKIIELKRVVITGMGLVTSLGLNVYDTWQAVLAGKSGIDRVTRLNLDDIKDLPESFPMIAGEVKNFQAKEFLQTNQIKQADLFIQYGLVAAQEAINQAGISIEEEDAIDYGAIIGVGFGGFPAIERNHHQISFEGYKRVDPRFILKVINNMLPGYIAIQHGLRGPNYAVTSACASGCHAIGESFEKIQWGRAKVIITGGAESTITPLGIAGFNIIKALSRRNGEPEKACRPFDKDRDGFVMAEGAGILVLEELGHAKRRGANILGEIVGYGLTNDASHPTEPDMTGAYECMMSALKYAQIEPEEVDLINPHATSTPKGDINESQALMKIFGKNNGGPLVTASKSQLGHSLGAAGGIEAILTLLSIRDNIVPPILNLEDIDNTCKGLNYVRDQAREGEIKVALSNSFGFGGTNASLILKEYPED